MLRGCQTLAADRWAQVERDWRQRFRRAASHHRRQSVLHINVRSASLSSVDRSLPPGVLTSIANYQPRVDARLLRHTSSDGQRLLSGGKMHSRVPGALLSRVPGALLNRMLQEAKFPAHAR